MCYTILYDNNKILRRWEFMISTSSYNNWQSNQYITYSISGDREKSVNYKGRCYSKLVPKLSFWKIWYDNIGKVSAKKIIDITFKNIGIKYYQNWIHNKFMMN